MSRNGIWGCAALHVSLALSLGIAESCEQLLFAPPHCDRLVFIDVVVLEEMQHADKIVDRIIFLDGFPNMQVLDPLHIGQNVKEVLDCDLAAEYSARALYEEAATHCHSVKDYVTRDLFEKLMKDEEDHIDFLETQLELVSKLGVELYSQHHIGKLGEKED